MRRAEGRWWLVSAVACLAVSGVLLGASLGEGGSLAPGAPSRASPPWPPLSVQPSAYDPAAGVDVWLVGGAATWTYGNGTWANITSTAGVPQAMGSNSAMVYDARDGYVLLYGGATATGPLADTWTFQDGHWSNLTSTVAGAPPPQLIGLMAYDSADRVVLLFGGSLTYSSRGNATWTYAARTWTNMTVPGPPGGLAGEPRSAFLALTDDPSAGYVLYYNGLGNCTHLCPLLWTYAGGRWTNRTASTSPLPDLTDFGLFTYDSASGDIVVLGGCLSTLAYPCSSQAWGTYVFANGSWRDVSPSSQPSARLFSSWVDDPSDDGVMLVGGCCWADFSGLSLPWQDEWIFAHGSWREALPWSGGPEWELANDGTWIGFGIGSLAALGLAYSAFGPSRGRAR